MTTFYMKHGDVEGETTFGHRRNWIHVYSFELALENGAARQGAGGSAGLRRRSYTPYVLRRPVDKATPQLMRLAANNEIVGEVRIDAFDSNSQDLAAGRASPVLQFIFGNVSIRSIKQTLFDGRFFEELTCAFQKIEIITAAGATFNDDLGD